MHAHSCSSSDRHPHLPWRLEGQLRLGIALETSSGRRFRDIVASTVLYYCSSLPYKTNNLLLHLFVLRTVRHSHSHTHVIDVRGRQMRAIIVTDTKEGFDPSSKNIIQYSMHVIGP